ncbi:MAG TPA: hypothetical protein VFN53_08705 [Acidobacteriaceae bacterium]|nr:hypothetical protein [Acidobacteriaceae bacterium]
MRRSFVLCVYGYVGMAEHVHPLMSEPGSHPFKPKYGLNGAPALALALLFQLRYG